MRIPRRKGPAGPVHAVRRTGQPGPRFNYELFNCNNFNIRYWSWNYRGCWPFYFRSSGVGYPGSPGAPPPMSGSGRRCRHRRPSRPLHDGCSGREHPFGWDSTSLEPLHSGRCLSARYDGPRGRARHGITIRPRGRVGFPVPGHLAGIHPSPHECSTSSHVYSLWRQQFGTVSTRLALQLFLVKGFKLYSFQLQDP